MTINHPEGVFDFCIMAKGSWPTVTEHYVTEHYGKGKLAINRLRIQTGGAVRMAD